MAVLFHTPCPITLRYPRCGPLAFPDLPACTDYLRKWATPSNLPNYRVTDRNTPGVTMRPEIDPEHGVTLVLV